MAESEKSSKRLVDILQSRVDFRNQARWLSAIAVIDSAGRGSPLVPQAAAHLNPPRLVAEHVVPYSQICAKPPSTNNSIPVT
jgi:hypothetical protein